MLIDFVHQLFKIGSMASGNFNRCSKNLFSGLLKQNQKGALVVTGIRGSILMIITLSLRDAMF
ncbi:hypothetical protein SAMN05428947_101403 [Mucilaginibacter sp. OK283]|nr:hypothetical protein SAMN05428947_101403 [Mucilaginibacter sp. OK283]